MLAFLARVAASHEMTHDCFRDGRREVREGDRAGLSAPFSRSVLSRKRVWK